MEKLTEETKAKVVKEFEGKQDTRGGDGGGGVRGVIFRSPTSTSPPRLKVF
jgi:hypothetical protein